MASVLLIDGDHNSREALAIALRLDGCAVTALDEADAGLLELRRGRFDLCLVDLNVSGVERLLAAAALHPTPVLLTGPHTDLLEAVARRYPPVRVLTKPVGAAALLERLAGGATSPPRWRPAPGG